MTPTEASLRRAVLLVGALAGLGTVLELGLLEHVEGGPQLLPFAVIGLGLATIGAALAAPRRSVFLGVRGVAALLVLAGAFGVFEHLEHNYAFAAEIRPTAEWSELVVPAILGGNPALAPGAVALMGVLMFLATWRDTRMAQ